jgi:FMN phosphatase YigB (HAD superfamily)
MSNNQSLIDIKAVAFDVFGRIAEIQQTRKPYAALLRHLRRLGGKADPLDGTVLMSNNLSLAEAAQHFGFVLAPDMLSALEQDLRTELDSTQLFPDALPAIARLRNAGFKVAVCSNLAAPYAQPITSLVPFSFDAYAWSFEVGAIKPAPAMYDRLCHSLGCSPREVLVVGDTGAHR